MPQDTSSNFMHLSIGIRIELPDLIFKLGCALVSLVAIFLTTARAADAMFESLLLRRVPIERLLTNLQSKLDKQGLSAAERARLEFQIGRLHSMAYAEKTEEGPINEYIDERNPKPASDRKNLQNADPYYGWRTDFNQFYIAPARDPMTLSNAKEHLSQAITHLRKSIDLDQSFEPTYLGLAWCLDQAGNKTEALPLYREVFAHGFALEKDGYGPTGSVGNETAGYLLNLLDPVKDAAEIKDIKEKRETLQNAQRTVTPIVVPLCPTGESRNIMRRHSVVFDLDGNGERRYEQWPSREAGWLVFDSGARITSGLQLFGPKTFWIFWQNGYEALSAFDANDDGYIDGAESDGLAVWCDANCNGISEPGEVRALKDCGIVRLSCRAHSNADGMLFSSDGVQFADGRTATTYDWVLSPGR